MSTDISLKVNVPSINLVKTMVFKSDHKISQVKDIILEKIPDKIQSDEKPNYMVFIQDKDNKKKGCWLDMNRDIKFYNLKPGQNIYFKNKMAHMKIKMMDGSKKVILMDQLLTVKDILVILGEKLGMSNIAEYSLCLEVEESDSSSDSEDETATKGLLHKKLEKREQKRIERMKRQLHTDDDLKWLVHEKRISDQGVEFESLFLLRRKYFLEANENISDPIEVNLLYNQCRDGILGGATLCTFEEASKFAAYQFQIEHGGFSEEKYKTSNFELKNYYPKEFVRARHAKENMIKEQKKITEKDPVMLKHQYTKLCQNLKTYGISIFLVKEKKQGKNRLSPILLGISKDNIIRMDQNTKEIVQKWPLTVIRRWAASKNSFSLDFGDFEDNTYSVLTSESEHIAQLVSGYIELIISKKNNPTLKAYSPNVDTVYTGKTNKSRGIVNRRTRPGGDRIEGGTYNDGYVEMPSYFNLGETKKNFSAKNQSVIDIRDIHEAENNYYNDAVITNKMFIHEINELQQACSQINLVELECKSVEPMSEEEYENLKRILKDYMALLGSAAIRLLEMRDKYKEPKYILEIKQLNTTLVSMMERVKEYSAYLNDSEATDLLNACQDLMRCLVGFTGCIKGEDDHICVDVEVMKKQFTAVCSALQNLGAIVKISENDTKVEEAIMKNGKYLTLEMKVLVEKARLIMADKAIPKELREAIRISSREVTEAASNLVLAGRVLASTYSNPTSKMTIENFKAVLATKLNHLNSLCNMGDSETCEDLKQCCANLLNSLRNVFVTEQQSHDLKLEEMGYSLEKLRRQADITEGLCIINNPLAISECKLFLENAHHLQGLIESYKFMCSNDDLRNSLEEFLKNYQSALSKLVVSVNDKNLDQIQLYVIEAKKLAMKYLSDFIKNYNTSCLEDAALNVVSSLNNLAINVDENKQLIYTKSMQLNQAVERLKADPNSNLLLASLISSAQNTSDFSKSIIEEEQRSLDDYDSKAMSALVFRKLHILSASVNTLDNSLKKFTQKNEFSDELDYLDKLQKECSNMAAALIDLANGCNEKAVTNKHTQLALSKCLNSLMKTYEDSRNLNHSVFNEEYGDYVGRYQSTQNKLCDLLEKMKNVIEGKCVDKSTAKKLANKTENLVKCSDKVKEAIKQTLSNNSKDNNVQILNRLNEFDECILSTAALIPGSKILIETISSFRALVKDLQDSKFKTSDSESDLMSEFHKDISKLCGMLLDFYSNVRDGTSISKEQLQAITDQTNKCRQTGMKISTKLNPNVRPHFIKVLTSILNGVIVSLTECTSGISDSEFPIDCVSLFDSIKDVVMCLRDLTSPVLNFVPGRKEIHQLYYLCKYHSEVSLQSASYSINEEINYWACINNLEGIKSILITLLTKSIPPNEPSKLSPKMINIFNQLSRCVRDVVEETHQACYLRVSTKEATKQRSYGNFIDSNMAKILKDKLSQLSDNIVKNMDSKKELSNLLEEFETLDREFQHIFYKYFNNLGLLSSGDFIDDLKTSYQELATSSALYRETIEKGTRNDLNKENLSEAAERYLESLTKLAKLACNPNICIKYIKMDEKKKNVQKTSLEKGQLFLQGFTSYADNYKNYLTVLQPSRNIDKQITKDINAIIDVLNELISELKNSSPNNSEITKLISTLLDKQECLAPYIIGGTDHGKPQDVDESKILQDIETIRLCCDEYRKIEPSRKASNDSIRTLTNLTETVCNLCDNAILMSLHMKDDGEIKNSQKDRAELLNKCKELLTNSILMADSVNDHKQCILLGEVPITAKTASEKVKSNVKEIGTLLNMYTGKYLSKQDNSKNLEKTLKRFTAYMDNKGEPRAVSNGDELLKPEQTVSEIIIINKKMVKSAVKNIDELPALQCQASSCFDELCHEIEDLKITNDDILDSILKLGQATLSMGNVINQYTSDPKNPKNKKEFAQNSKNTLDCATNIMKKLQSTKGVEVIFAKFCKELQTQMSDAEASQLFAETGTLDFFTSESFENNAIKVEAKYDTVMKLLKDLQNAVNNGSDVNPSINELSVVLKDLGEIINETVSSLGSDDKDSQVNLIKNHYEFLSILNNTLSDYKSNNPSSFNTENVISALQLSKAGFTSRSQSQNDSQIAIRNLKEHVEKRFQKIISSNCENLSTSGEHIEPEKLVRLSKNITETCQKLMSAYNHKKTSEYPSHCSNGVQSLDEFLNNMENYLSQCKSDQEFMTSSKDLVINSLSDISSCFSELLSSLQKSLTSADEAKLQVNSASREVTQSLVQFLKVMSKIKGKAFVDPDDPNIQAEKELYSAAAKIEAAAKKLSELKPKKVSETGEVNENLNFEEQIIEAATSITNAAKLLVAAATHAQRELVSSGVFFSSSSNSKEDGQWSQGLISAAQLVAQATSDLCEAANSAVKGEANEEKIIAAANSISHSTIQLIMACKVKADPFSEGQKRLQASGNAIKKATKALVEAVHNSGVFKREKDVIIPETQFVGSRKQELNMMEEILRKERELNEAREKLFQLRKHKNDELSWSNIVQ